jgi:threonine dehydrogenase-like Zn-dependent dehydrogenase
LIVAKTVYLDGPYKLDIREQRLDRSIGDSEVLCQTLATVISPGTELAAFTGQPPLRPGKVYPRLVGYCNVALVLACGGAVEKCAIGDRVLTFQSHRSHFIVDQSEVICVVPNGIVDQHAAFSYLYHLGYDTILKTGVVYGSQVVVIGLGVLGLTTIALASKAGATVFGVSDHERPKELASLLGAEKVYSRSAFEELESDLAPRAADVVVVSTNSWTDWEIALRIAGHHSTIGVLGFPGRGQPKYEGNPLDSQYFYTKQLRILAVGLSPENEDSRHFLKFNEVSNLGFILRSIKNESLNPEALISGVYEGTQIKEAYQALVSRTGSPTTFSLRW